MMLRHHRRKQRHTTRDGPRLRRNECTFRFVCLESAACDPCAGSRLRLGRSAVPLADDLSVRPVPARATLYARPRPKMAGEARARRWAVDEYWSERHTVVGESQLDPPWQVT